MTDFDQSADEVANHAVKKAVAIEGTFQNTTVFLYDTDGTDSADGGFAGVARVRGEGGEVVFSREELGGATHGGKIEGAWDMPGTSDFQGVEGVGVGDSVEVGFPFGGKTGMKAGSFATDGKNANSWRKMKVKSFGEDGGFVDRGKIAGSNLAEGMYATIGPTRASDSDGLIKDFGESGFESELNGGLGVLTLPAKEIFAPIGEKETVGNRHRVRTQSDQILSK